jgi:hypothetical protein
MVDTVFTAAAVLDDFSGAFQSTDLADAENRFVVPQNSEFKVLVRIKAMGIDYKTVSHEFFSLSKTFLHTLLRA